MKKCTNNRTMSFRRLLSLLLGLVLFMELLLGGLTVVGDAVASICVAKSEGLLNEETFNA